MNEVEDGVSARIHTRDERGPCHRTEGRHCRLQRFEVSFGNQLLEVGEVTLIHESLKQPGVEPVDAEDDHLFGRRGAATG